VIVIVGVVLVIVQMVANYANLFRQGFLHHCGLSLAPGDTADIRRVHSQALGDTVINAAKKRDGRDRIRVTIHLVTIHDEPFATERNRSAE
jgi:hypothetical protein